jgi:hypothetical protein
LRDFCAGLHAHGQLHEAADLDPFGVAELVTHDLLERRERELCVGPAQVCVLGGGGGELSRGSARDLLGNRTIRAD